MKKYFVIGNPINHSLSPKLHNHWFKENNINAIYDKKKIEEKNLKNIISEVKEMLLNHGEIDSSKTLMVNFVKFGPSSLDFFIYTFTKTTEWVRFHAIKQEIMFTILEIISKHNAEIAFPTQSLQIENLTGLSD